MDKQGPVEGLVGRPWETRLRRARGGGPPPTPPPGAGSGWQSPGEAGKPAPFRPRGWDTVSLSCRR